MLNFGIGTGLFSLLIVAVFVKCEKTSNRAFTALVWGVVMLWSYQGPAGVAPGVVG